MSRLDFIRNDLGSVKNRIKEKRTKPKKDRRLCSRCEQNFYNGNNPLGVKECWNFESAKVILRKQVGMNDRPPWNWPSQYFLSCYQQKGCVFINGERTE